MQSEPQVMAYCVMGANRTFVGELVTEDATKLQLRKVLIFSLMKQGNDVGVAVMPVEYASRDSVLTIDKSTLPGYTLTDLDSDVVSDYKTKVVSAYSKLALA